MALRVHPADGNAAPAHRRTDGLRCRRFAQRQVAAGIASPTLPSLRLQSRWHTDWTVPGHGRSVVFGPSSEDDPDSTTGQISAPALMLRWQPLPQRFLVELQRRPERQLASAPALAAAE